MKTSRILNSKIYAGGRSLTSTEIKALRKDGHSMSNDSMVMPNGSEHVGIGYYPCKSGGWSNAGIMVVSKHSVEIDYKRTNFTGQLNK